MNFRSIFRMITGKPATSLDQIDRMVTRGLPVPDRLGTKLFFQFIAEQQKDGQWSVYVSSNSSDGKGNIPLSDFPLAREAMRKAQSKHLSKKPAKGLKMDFDTAFLFLRELEESFLEYGNSLPAEEPFQHYMAAYRLMPAHFQAGLDDLYKARHGSDDNILPPRGTPPGKRPSQP